MRHRASARVTTGLALVAAVLAFFATPAAAAVDGFQVSMGQSPATFTIGQQARTLTASVATDRLRRCIKVRWSLVITTDGVSLDQIRVNRVCSTAHRRLPLYPKNRHRHVSPHVSKVPTFPHGGRSTASSPTRKDSCATSRRNAGHDATQRMHFHDSQKQIQRLFNNVDER